jgi:hypothetical protein
MSPFLQKTLGCLTGVVVGIIAVELLLAVIALALGGIGGLSAMPFRQLVPLAAFFSVLAVAPWPMIGSHEGYGPVWFSSLVFSVGVGIIGGFIASVVHNEMAHLELNVLLHAGFAFCAGFCACLTVHLLGVFKRPEGNS